MKQGHTSTECWPPDRFYWAVLEVPGWKPSRRTAALPPGLAAQVAEELPLDAAELHAVIVPAGNDRIVVCAAAREALSRLGHRVMRLSVERLPECVAELNIEPDGINLLVGEFEPTPIRRARWHRHLFASAATLAVATLVCVGMLRRAQHWEEVRMQANAAALAILDHAAVPKTDDGVEPTTALLAESIRLQRLADAATKIKPPLDVAPTLAGFLAAWPTSVPSKPQSINLAATSVSLAVTLEQDPAPFLTAFAPPAGWSMEEPRLNRAGSVTRVNLQLRPAPAVTPSGAKP